MIAQDKAETVALQALGWLAGNEDLFPVFLGATGADVSDLATAATQPTFLAAVMDFLLTDDAWVMAFCDDAQLRYEVPMQARAMLPGGAQINWT
jgi:hypothetical protein